MNGRDCWVVLFTCKTVEADIEPVMQQFELLAIMSPGLKLGVVDIDEVTVSSELNILRSELPRVRECSATPTASCLRNALSPHTAGRRNLMVRMLQLPLPYPHMSN